jgi:PAS domain S-box-containing protein
MSEPDASGHAHERFQQALLALTTDDDVADGNFDAAARTITESAADILDVGRVNVWLFDDDDETLRCVDQYDRRTDDHEAGMELTVADYPAYVDALRTHRSIAAADARSDPRTAGLAEDYLDPEGVDSLLDATLRSEGEVVGVVCHEAVDGPREWTDVETELAADVADVGHRAWRNHVAARQREELEMGRSLLEAQQEAIPGGLLVVGRDERILSYNDEFADLFGVPVEHLESGDLAAVVAAVEDSLADPEGFTETRQFLAANPDESTRRTIELEDGRILEGHSTPVLDEDDAIRGRLWMVRDVTDRRERARELERKNRAIEEAPIGITLTEAGDEDNPLTYVNERFSELTGYPKTELLRTDCRVLQGEETADEPVGRMRRAIDREEPTTVELRNYRKDGTAFWNRVTIAPVEDDDGALTGYVGFQQDVTDRREATRQLEVLHRVLRHNLSNQMSVIRGTAEQLAADTDGAASAAALDIVEEADELLGITDKHREIVRLLSERPTPSPTMVDGVVSQAVEAVATAHPAASIRVDAAGSASARAIPALQTAVEELVENAVVHAGTAAPSVDVAVRVDPETVEIRVRDGGPGIPAEERDVLTGEGDVDPLYHGMGMGLWLVYWIVTLSGGTVAVEDGTGGTAVRVELPRSPA